MKTNNDLLLQIKPKKKKISEKNGPILESATSEITKQRLTEQHQIIINKVFTEAELEEL